MPTVLPQPQPQAFPNLMRAQARALRDKDQPPKTRDEWLKRRAELRRQMFQAMGPMPEKPCPLEPRIVGTLKRPGYRIEKLLLQTRPDVWMTSSLYVPNAVKGRLPAVLVVHGHWRGARRDPVVQARCLGLVQLGFVVLAVDAFGAGERYITLTPGGYHGALQGSALWPSGHTLLGLQVYDNQRAVDYLQSRPEVDGRHLGVTGASGGGNQTMYAGALDERFGAIVPVCSVGTYQAYLHAACCVCEALPGALRFTEEGQVLGLVAPQALMVVNATRDGFQFSVEQARLSIQRARPIFELYKAADKLRHATFESGHDYNQAMRETMYGWMTRWLKNEDKGTPIPEPKHQIEKLEDLACFPDGKRPESFTLLPAFAGRVARAVVERTNNLRHDHVEAWEATAVSKRSQLRREVFGDFPAAPKPEGKLGKATTEGGIRTTPVILHPEADMPVPALLQRRANAEGALPACVLVHLDGKDRALKHPLAAGLLERNWAVLAPDVRATGETQVAGDSVAGAPDHNSAEHALWLGRPLLGQWVFDVSCLLDWLALQPGIDRRRLSVVGLGPAGLAALCASALLPDRVLSAGAIETPATLVTSEPFATGFRMGLLAPGLLQVGDVPHLGALTTPRKLVIAEPQSLAGKPLADKSLREAFAFTRSIYRLHKIENRLTVMETMSVKEIVEGL